MMALLGCGPELETDGEGPASVPSAWTQAEDAEPGSLDVELRTLLEKEWVGCVRSGSSCQPGEPCACTRMKFLFDGRYLRERTFTTSRARQEWREHGKWIILPTGHLQLTSCTGAARREDWRVRRDLLELEGLRWSPVAQQSPLETLPNPWTTCDR